MNKHVGSWGTCFQRATNTLGAYVTLLRRHRQRRLPPHDRRSRRRQRRRMWQCRSQCFCSMDLQLFRLPWTPSESLSSVSFSAARLHTSITPPFGQLFFNMLSIEMSAGLVVRHGRARSEAEVRHELVSPLLRRIAHCVSSMAAPEGWDEGVVYSSLLNVETSTEDRPHTPGPKPRVDYTLCGHSSGKLLYRIPFEVKKSMAADDIAQLVQYAGSLACQGEFVRQNTSLAFLIDENYYRIGFSPFSLGNLPLPICIFTPPIRWRKGTRLEQGPCVALCLLQRLVIKRTAVS